MHIRKLTIENFGCLRDVTLELGPLNVLVGPNDAGKSMILRALEYVSVACTHRSGWGRVYRNHEEFLQATFGGRGGEQCFVLSGTFDGQSFKYEVRLGARSFAVTEILHEELRFGDDIGGGVRITRRHPNLHRATVLAGEREIELQVGGSGAIPLLSRHNALVAAPPEANSAVEQLRKMVAVLPVLRRFHLRPSVLRRAVPVNEKLPEEPQITMEGYGLAGAIANLLLGDRGRADRIEAALREALPGVLRVKVITRDVLLEPIGEAPPGVERSYGLALETAQGVTVASRYISDGVVLYLAYLLLAHGPSSHSVLLLEEPETGIHPGLLERVVETLRALSDGSGGGRGVQVLLTTHSPLLLNFVEPHEIRVVVRGDDGATRVTPFDSAPDLARLMEFQGPGEIWVNMGEEHLRPNDSER